MIFFATLVAFLIRHKRSSGSQLTDHLLVTSEAHKPSRARSFSSLEYLVLIAIASLTIVATIVVGVLFGAVFVAPTLSASQTSVANGRAVAAAGPYTGTVVEVFPTDNLQTKLSGLCSGGAKHATLVIHAGTYRLAVKPSSSCSGLSWSQPFTIRAAIGDENKVFIKGSNVVTPDASNCFPYTAKARQTDPGWGGSGLQLNVDMVFINGVHQVQTLTTPSAGQFQVSGGRICLGSPTSGKTVEVAIRENAFQLSSAGYLWIRDIDVSHVANRDSGGGNNGRAAIHLFDIR